MVVPSREEMDMHHHPEMLREWVRARAAEDHARARKRRLRRAGGAAATPGLILMAGGVRPGARTERPRHAPGAHGRRGPGIPVGVAHVRDDGRAGVPGGAGVSGVCLR